MAGLVILFRSVYCNSWRKPFNSLIKISKALGKKKKISYGLHPQQGCKTVHPANQVRRNSLDGLHAFSLTMPSFCSSQFSLRICLVTRPVRDKFLAGPNQRLVGVVKIDDGEVKCLFTVV